LLHSHGEGEGAATTPAGSAFVPPLSTQSDDDEIESASLLEEIEQAEEAKDVMAAEAEPARAPHAVLLVPRVRQYDPNEVTVVSKEAGLAYTRKSLLSELTGEGPPPAQSSTKISTPLPDPRSWSNEKPASEWLSASTREALEARAAWLEQETRALDDDVARARGLLACSEICATIGERERAQELAADARNAAPSLAFAHQQARALMTYSTSDCNDYVEALEAEIEMTEVPAAQIHAALLAATALRATGQQEMAARWIDRAAEVAGGDARAIVARLAAGLARNDKQEATFRLPDAPGLAPIAEGLDTCLRLRSVRRDTAASARDPSPTEVLLLARQSVDGGHVAEAAPLIAELARLPEIAPAALWLAASLGTTHSTRRVDAARWLRELAERGDDEARRALLARALELGDKEQLAEGLASGGSVTSAERVTLAVLGGLPLSAIDPHLDATASTPGMVPLAAALTSLATPADGDRDAHVQARAQRTAGSPNARAVVRLARLLAASSPQVDIESALAEIEVDHASEQEDHMTSAGAPPAGVRGIALEMAMRAGRMSDVCAALEAWGAGSDENDVMARLAAALVAEHASEQSLALQAFKAVRTAYPTNEASLRAIASLEQVDLVAEMNDLADRLGGGFPSAVAWIEAAARGEGVLPEPTRARMLEQAHAAAPALPIASFLAERIARRAGDIDEVLRWVRERRASSSDAVDSALDAVREALLVADREPLLAGERLQEAHRVRPHDTALRELYERMGSESSEARAAWREEQASGATGDGRALLLLEAAHEYARAGDEEAALRCAELAGADETSLGGVARERSELRSRRVERLSEELLSKVKGADDARARCEAYERLATLDRSARQDPAAALRWYRVILEELPKHEPSLRYVEHHLIGEGLDDELEPIATAIAAVLRGTGPGEGTAHAELAARLRLRGADANWGATKDVVEFAAAESETSLWSLRMLQTHARAPGDDALLLTSALRLVDRGSRPAETATLLVRAAEAALRLGRLEEAGSLLERASVEDPGDVVAWTHLIDVRRRAGDLCAAAEACEALARSSVARENQVKAWHEAGCIWLDDAKDEDRAIVALEAAGA
ncbi:MAG: hypothetical protein M3O46_08010, partial [Myxococcota bacterium]|nr:hypothetical protein [Myxococcota bacterium]